MEQNDKKLNASEQELDSTPLMTTETADQSPADQSPAAVDQEVNHKEMSPMRLVFKRFFRSKLSVTGLIIIVLLFTFSFLGPLFLTSWGETEVDKEQSRTIFVHKIIDYVDEDGNPQTAYEVIYVTYQNNIYAAPSFRHWLGTDDKGMDVFTRLMYGGRISLTLSFIVIILETVLGVIMGGLAGYFGKWVDQVIMRLVDVFNCLPMLPILLIASALLDSWHVPQDMRIYYLMMILTVFGWSGIARIVRGQILSLREQEYMVAAEAMGFGPLRRIFKHLLPNVMPQLIVSMTLGLGGVILYESTLSYLGLGIQIPKAAWGTMISAATDTNILANYVNMWAPPGICIVLAVLAFNFVGDGLRDALDPRMKK